jgi:hypothetical protein
MLQLEMAAALEKASSGQTAVVCVWQWGKKISLCFYFFRKIKVKRRRHVRSDG